MITYKRLTDFGIHATDGDIGRCKDVLFDDQNFFLRYFVADTNKWLPLGRKVVLSPISLSAINHDDETLVVSMSKQALKDSPTIDEHKPVSREYEEMLFKYFGYGYYWVGPGAWGDFSHPTELADQQSFQQEISKLENQGVNHLRSCEEVHGYDVATTDEDTGHITDFIIDPDNWAIKLLIVDTRNWLPGGKKVALPPNCVETIDWSTHKIHVNLCHDSVMALPDFEEDKMENREYLNTLEAKATLALNQQD
ncbi:PRC-barrel domain-containing protein [Alteromonas sp. C1M14]|uniref:PRC-barrel domain-containing protein n=1 Tax=Alteromonas sp. C1M14 TaxID=2841567 RepID=UPI001C0884ED|nr:PRC-barrel domain-containing protein [Alteromonas sp. C1M14]MBU2977162.1 PRC-barrel domain-containing protein [Alteromonas sp. C1M14]